jgi:hypothetical protein
VGVPLQLQQVAADPQVVVPHVCPPLSVLQ